MSSSDYGPFNVRAKTREAVGHHYDEDKSGKPLYLILPGGIIALASLALMVFLGYRIWGDGTLPQANGLTLMAILAPIYIGGVFLFSYGYELYNLPKALRLTAIIVFITLAAVVIVAVLAAALGTMGNKQSRTSKRSTSSAPSQGGGGRGMGFGIWPIFFGGLGSQKPTVVREVVHDEPAVPPAQQPFECPYCGKTYVPAETDFTCPACGAETPKAMVASEGDSTAVTEQR